MILRKEQWFVIGLWIGIFVTCAALGLSKII